MIPPRRKQTGTIIVPTSNQIPIEKNTPVTHVHFQHVFSNHGHIIEDYILRRQARMKITFFTLIVSVIYDILILIEEIFTPINGLPSISEIMATDLSFTILITLFLGSCIPFAIYLTTHYTSSTHVYTKEEAHLYQYKLKMYDGWIYILSRCALLFTVIELISFLLIPVAPTTKLPTIHVIIACLIVVFFLLSSSLFCFRRILIFKLFEKRFNMELESCDAKTKAIPKDYVEGRMKFIFGFVGWRKIIFINWMYILITFICGAVFFLYNVFEFYPERFIPISISEIYLFKLIIWEYQFHVLDVYVSIQNKPAE